MTSPSEPRDPSTAAGLPEGTDRHPYAPGDFGITPRAIDPSLAAEPAGDDATSLPVLEAGDPIPPARPVDEAPADRPADPYTGEPVVSTRRSEPERREEIIRRRRSLLRPGDIGIYVPLGFAVISLAVLLTFFLFDYSGVYFGVAFLVLLICLLATAVTTLDLIATVRRRRRAGEDVAHAVGLE